MTLLDRRLLVVTGKGGVGKTTVAAALGLVAARRGLRTIVAEVAQRGDVASAFDRPGSEPFEEVEIAPGLFHISIDPQDALEEYLRDQLPSGAVAEVLIRSRVFAMVAAATPGMRELLTVGKLWELAQLDRRTPGADAYDLVVVDAPATGHGVAVLSAIVSSILDEIDTLGDWRRALPNHYARSWTELFVPQIDLTPMLHGVLWAVLWAAALTALAYGHFRRKDVLS